MATTATTATAKKLKTRLTINGAARDWQGDGAQPLLWAMRETRD